MSTSIKIVFSIIILMQVTVTNAQITTESNQEIGVPITILEHFYQKFPSMKEPGWSIYYQGLYNQQLVYKGKFMYDNRSSLVVYDRDGNLLVFAVTIEKYEIPDKINTYMTEKFPSFPIVESLLVTRGQNEISYEIGIYIDNQYIIKVFSESGDFIKTTKA